MNHLVLLPKELNNYVGTDLIFCQTLSSTNEQLTRAPVFWIYTFRYRIKESCHWLRNWKAF